MPNGIGKYVYSATIQLIRDLYNSLKRPLDPKNDLQPALESTQGLRFSPGTTVEDVIDTLCDWKRIKRSPEGIIPLPDY